MASCYEESTLQFEVNQVLKLLNLPYKCIKWVKPDGNCFFRAIIQLMHEEEVTSTFLTSQSIMNHVDLRRAVIRFMEENQALNEMESFIQQKLVKEKKEGWVKYLRRIGTDKIWADDFIIWCTALYIGKDILYASDENTIEAPWTLVPGYVNNTIFKSTFPPLTVAYLSQRHFEPIHHQPEDSQCHGCGKRGIKVILSHLNHKANVKKLCQLFYDMDGLKSNAREVHKEQKRKRHLENQLEDQKDMKIKYQKNKRRRKEISKQNYEKNVNDRRQSIRQYKAKHREEYKQYYKQYDAKHKEKKKDSFRQYYAKHKEKRKQSFRQRYQRRREELKAIRDAQKALEFENEDEFQRFVNFTKRTKDAYCIVCASCRRIFSRGSIRSFFSDRHQLKKRLDDNGLFKTCFLDGKDLPKNVDVELPGPICLCNTCVQWLNKKQQPPKNNYNGLICEYIPSELKKLNDLEAILISKNIIFLKIFETPKSRFSGTRGRAVNVPILKDDILQTYNTIRMFPRQPDEAGLIPVKLKRKLEYKNHVLYAYINPNHLIAALKKLKELKNPNYADIEINETYGNSNLPPQDSSQSDSLSESESESESNDDSSDSGLEAVRKQQYNISGETVMTDAYPECAMAFPQSDKSQKDVEDDSDEILSLAPGEGKIPTNLMREPNWDTASFPLLHPSGKFGLNHKRVKNLPAQQYFIQRISNVNKMFSQNKGYVFSCLNYIERQHLERQVNLSYRRGKVHGGTIENMTDVFSVFDNVTGTFRYWQQKRFEVIAKLEQLGPFHFFFTLSCADRRWDEIFVSLLRQRGLKITYEKVENPEEGTYSYRAPDIFVEEEGKPKQSLEDYLAHEKLHETIKSNVLTLTMVFDKRVQSFFRDIIMAKSNPMHIKYYHYRVEFQNRGAPHIHGVLWSDMNMLEKDFPGIKDIMKKLKAQVCLTSTEKETMVKFIDRFVQCSLDEKGLVDIVTQVQRHHHSHTCYKKGKKCRFGYPRFPCEETMIAQPMKSSNYSSETAFNHEKKRLKNILSKVKDILEELTEDELDTKTLMDILRGADISKSDYYKALQASETGACVILKRKVKEIYINNYNSEWLKAWNANLDIAICLDFYAIVTYITDYYTKSETAMNKLLKDAAKESKGKAKKDQMMYMVQTFLTHRSMGESEAYYRLFPHLYLSKSNVGCEFVATGFPFNRNKYLRKIPDKLLHDDDEEELAESTEGVILVPGHEGKFKLPIPIHDKYANRPKALDNMCLAQFAMSYETTPSSTGSKKKYVEDVCGLDEDQKIIALNSEHEDYLPSFIKLSNNKGYMRLRKLQKILRYHKFREDEDAHEYYYSELVLYKTWRSENEDLGKKSLDECLNLVNEYEEAVLKENMDPRETNIGKLKAKLFPHKDGVQEARAMIEDLPEQRPSHIGDQLDPENEQANEDQEASGEVANEEYAGRDPGILNEEPKLNAEKTTYKRIDITKHEEMLKSVRQLDEDQRYAFDIIIKYVKRLLASRRSSTPRPKPPLIKIHGGAGCGKTKLIHDIATWTEYFMSLGGNKDPDSPSVLKLAFTGKAAKIIKGMTLHQALKIPWGNEYTSLSDQMRGSMNRNLEHLELIIIDEMSMVKADMLYQIFLRLQEIKGNKMPFGGIALILCGDLMQLRPVLANCIFEPPKDEGFQISHDMFSLWDLFDSVELTKNHRQGNDKQYGDLLNRLRMGKHTKDDERMLQARVSDKFPPQSTYVYGKNKPKNEQNNLELNQLQTPMVTLKATHVHAFIKNFKPIIKDDGSVHTTPFLDQLNLKVGARVMLTYNIDTVDGLTNGTMGHVVDYIYENGKVTHVLVKFDDPEDGKELRKQNKALLRSRGHADATPIKRICMQYRMGGKTKNHNANAKVIQFPLVLAWGVTAHKCQGMTIFSPESLVVDLNSVFEGGMAYVMLGRIQNIKQLYFKSFNAKKLYCNEKSLEEAKRLKVRALNCRAHTENLWKDPNCFIRKIVSLNIRSLPKHLEDLRLDSTMMSSDVILLQETFTSHHLPLPALPGLLFNRTVMKLFFHFNCL